MSLIERYIIAVTERLPENIRYDVAEELRSNIEDMLPDNATEDDIREVLEELGNPKKLAQEYNPTKRYLIGPAICDSYISVLKTVLGIAVSVIIFIALLDIVLKGPSNIDNVDSYVELFINLIETAVIGAFQAAFWVTFVFAIMERTGINEGEHPFSNKKWSLDDLPKTPLSEKSKISRAETVFSMFFTILFTTLVFFKPQLIAVYIKRAGTTEVTPLFNSQRLQIYLVTVLIVAVIQLCVAGWKFVQKNWNVPLAIANAIQNILCSILIILMFNDRQLFNNDFFAEMGEIFKISAAEVTDYWFLGTMLFSVVIFAGLALWDSISGFLKCRRKPF